MVYSVFETNSILRPSCKLCAPVYFHPLWNSLAYFTPFLTKMIQNLLICSLYLFRITFPVTWICSSLLTILLGFMSYFIRLKNVCWYLVGLVSDALSTVQLPRSIPQPANVDVGHKQPEEKSISTASLILKTTAPSKGVQSRCMHRRLRVGCWSVG